jgi:hypothetical protein
MIVCRADYIVICFRNKNSYMLGLKALDIFGLTWNHCEPKADRIVQNMFGAATRCPHCQYTWTYVYVQLPKASTKFSKFRYPPLQYSSGFFEDFLFALGDLRRLLQFCKAMHLWIALTALALLARVAQSALVDTGGVHGFTEPTPLIHNNDVSSTALWIIAATFRAQVCLTSCDAN